MTVSSAPKLSSTIPVDYASLPEGEQRWISADAAWLAREDLRKFREKIAYVLENGGSVTVSYEVRETKEGIFDLVPVMLRIHLDEELDNHPRPS